MRLWSTLSYKNRLRFLYAIFGVLLLLSWKSAIRPTFELYRQVKNARDEIERAGNAPGRMAKLEMEIQELKKGNLAPVYDDGKEMLIGFIAQCCSTHNITLFSLSKPDVQEQDGFLLMEYHIMLSGGYHGLLKAIHDFENDYPSGQVQAVSFFVKEDLKEHTRILYAQIVLIQIRHKEPSNLNRISSSG